MNALQLYRYHPWANKRVFQHLRELPESILHTQVQSVFPTIHELLVHLIVVDRIWLGTLSGDSFNDVMAEISGWVEEATGKDLAGLEAQYESVSEHYLAHLNRDADPDEVRPYHHPELGTLHARDLDIIQFIVNHGTYHRGNLSAMLRQLGHPGVPTDYIHFLYTVQSESV